MKKNNIIKKKKGFTLIELVIVLSVLAIIALIAVPNFAKIKQNALVSADNNSCAQVSSITQMAVAEGIIKINTTDETPIEFTLNIKDSDEVNIVEKKGTTIECDIEALKERYVDIKNPQSENFNAYKITISNKGKVKAEPVESNPEQ